MSDESLIVHFGFSIVIDFKIKSLNTERAFKKYKIKSVNYEVPALDFDTLLG